MNFHLIHPPPDLTPWVRAGVTAMLPGTPGHLEPVHFPAMVEGGLTVVLGGALFEAGPTGMLHPLPTSSVTRPHPAPRTLYRSGALHCVGLRLSPPGWSSLAGVTAARFQSPTLAAEDLFGAAWTPVVERLVDAPSEAARLHLLFEFVRGRVSSATALGQLTHASALQQAALDLRSARESLGLSFRQFERRFASTFGMAPKTFHRIARSEALLREAIRSGRTDAELALRHGYFDQSHMARDLRKFAPASLRALVRGTHREATPHWPLLVGSASEAGPLKHADELGVAIFLCEPLRPA